MTLFMVSIFLAFLVFVTVGDLASNLFGLKYGRRRIYKLRTVEGPLGFVGASLLASYILLLVVPVPLPSVVFGSLVAALVELFSEDINDNLTVGLLSCGFLYALRYLSRDLSGLAYRLPVGRYMIYII